MAERVRRTLSSPCLFRLSEKETHERRTLPIEPAVTETERWCWNRWASPDWPEGLGFGSWPLLGLWPELRDEMSLDRDLPPGWRTCSIVSRSPQRCE